MDPAEKRLNYAKIELIWSARCRVNLDCCYHGDVTTNASRLEREHERSE